MTPMHKNGKSKESKESKETKKTKEIKPEKLRCFQCRKKISLISFTCKCKKDFCVIHQSPHNHGCLYDYQRDVKERIKRMNPKVSPSTLVNPI